MNKYLEKIANAFQMDMSVLKGPTKPLTLSKDVVKKQPNPFKTETLAKITSGIAKRKGLKVGL